MNECVKVKGAVPQIRMFPSSPCAQTLRRVLDASRAGGTGASRHDIRPIN